MVNQQRLLETLRAFIAAPSPQTEPEQLRAFIADVVRPRLPAGYFDEIRIDVDGNLIARKQGRGSAQPLVLLTYGGTFPAEGMGEAAFRPQDVDGAVHGMPGRPIQGRGVTEQIAPLASAFEAVEALADEGVALERPLVFATVMSGETRQP